MINRIFIILEQTADLSDLPAHDAGVHYAIEADSSNPASLEAVCMKMMEMTQLQASHHRELALALGNGDHLTPAALRSIAAMLFLPIYLQLGKRPVILIKKDPGGEPASANALSAWLSGQGFREPLIYGLEERAIHRSVSSLIDDLQRILQSDPCHEKFLYYAPATETDLVTMLSRSREEEENFRARSPQLYDLILEKTRLEENFQILHQKCLSTDAELEHYRGYVEVLRTGHAAREIQDYYSREYEILPLWYKRFGHLLKVLAGKRTFSSLYRDDTKKYKV